MSNIIGTNNFHIVPLKKGNIDETKIQTYTEKSFMEIVKFLSNDNKNYYSYQLKSSKGLVVVIKGIESSVDSNDVREALEEGGFSIKSVVNIFNKNKVPQPMFKIELMPDSNKLKKNEIHPIYNLKYLLHRRITVEEPHKRNGPVQCTNCQEYGHTKAYCTLRSVCVVCGDLHPTSKCTLKKEDLNKKCSNCGGNHTANYRGCPVYKDLKSKLSQGIQARRNQMMNIPSNENIKIPVQISKPVNLKDNATQGSYANVVKGNTTQMQLPQNQPNGSVETMILNLTQCMTQFMASMQNMIQEVIKSQNQMLQTFLSKK
ncbi:nucleic-acid-binding protein from transposon X-element isoform X1 [Bactrocera neohumeralis]|uniref:nucleic-acid-binding protein from transposon X-element isoform X1 n=1 Tax=Bactrocera neohumeralis TaxID=98809 RepID=UPI00216543D6|nr:nucleic-acid-binding protein from transposon X-element isoform X1 [Bactrocera neohumeralis]